MVAFVVGVGNYKVHNDLKNPVPDAEAIKGVLESHGVEVFHVHDCKAITTGMTSKKMTECHLLRR